MTRTSQAQFLSLLPCPDLNFGSHGVAFEAAAAVDATVVGGGDDGGALE